MKLWFNFALWIRSFQNVQNCIYFLTRNFKFLLTDESTMKYSKDSIPTWMRWAGTVMMQADKDFLRRPRRTYRNFVRLWMSSGVSLLQMSSPHNMEPRLWIPIRKIFFCLFYWKTKRASCYFFSTLRGKCRVMYLKNTIYRIHIHNNYIVSNHSLISDDLIKIKNGMAFFSLPRYCAMSGKQVQV